jgi:hypothetical protein
LEQDDQTHLDRRKRELPKWFVITREIATSAVKGKNRRVTLYKFSGNRSEIVDEGQINRKIWAEVIHSARGLEKEDMKRATRSQLVQTFAKSVAISVSANA